MWQRRGSAVLKWWTNGNLRQVRGVSLRHRVQTVPAAHPATIIGHWEILRRVDVPDLTFSLHLVLEVLLDRRYTRVRLTDSIVNLKCWELSYRFPHAVMVSCLGTGVSLLENKNPFDNSNSFLKIPLSMPLKKYISTKHPVPAARCHTQGFRDRTHESSFLSHGFESNFVSLISCVCTALYIYNHLQVYNNINYELSLG
jgi:hypothetical protein